MYLVYNFHSQIMVFHDIFGKNIGFPAHSNIDKSAWMVYHIIQRVTLGGSENHAV